MYQCSHCSHEMSYPQDRCSSCGVLLTGVRCQGCQYVGGKQEFISNNHRCPKCGSSVAIPDDKISGSGFLKGFLSFVLMVAVAGAFILGAYLLKYIQHHPDKTFVEAVSAFISQR